MSKAYFKPQNDIMESDQPFRFSLLNSTGSATSYATNQVFTATANSSYKKRIVLTVCYISEPGLYSGTAILVQQPGDLQWQTNCVSNLQNNNTTRCLQKGERGCIVCKCQQGVSGLSRSRNSIELLAIKLSLLTFSKMFNLKSIHFQVDKMSALSYLMKMEDT